MVDAADSTTISQMLKKLGNNDSAPFCEVRVPLPLSPAQPSPGCPLHEAPEGKVHWDKDPVPFPSRHTAGLHFPVSLAVEWYHVTWFWPMKCEQN